MLCNRVTKAALHGTGSAILSLLLVHAAHEMQGGEAACNRIARDGILLGAVLSP